MRRTTLTFLIALSFISELFDKKIHIVSYLQEFGRGIDINSLSHPKQRPVLNPATPIDEKPSCPFGLSALTRLLDPKCNVANQYPTSPADRTDLFCHWVRYMAEIERKKNFIISGHSNWIREFFKRYGPTGESTQSRGLAGLFKKKTIPEGPKGIEEKLATDKISNTAMIKFTLKLDPVMGCRIKIGETEFMTPQTFANSHSPPQRDNPETKESLETRESDI
jgi:hypothetical protein